MIMIPRKMANWIRHISAGMLGLMVTSTWASVSSPQSILLTDTEMVQRYPCRLLVESRPAIQEGLTTYLISVELTEKGDRLSSIFGTDVHPVRINVPEGVFNSPFNGSWSASGVNPKLFEIMPEIQDDSFATIGLTCGSKVSELERAEDPMMVQDPDALPWDVFFNTNGETSMTIDTFMGGAWFVLRTASNGDPIEGKVLVMQITTSGSIEGALNAQIFPGNGSFDQVKVRFAFDGLGSYEGVVIS